MRLYKLTDSEGYTRNHTYWDIGVTVTAEDLLAPPILCSCTVLHAYTSPLLAELLDPCHAKYGKGAKHFLVEGDIVVQDGTKVGCRWLTVVDTYTPPSISTVQRIAFGILSALRVWQVPAYVEWATNWLSNIDRSKGAATYAAYATSAASAASVASAAAYAANAAVYGADPAAGATYVAYAASDASAAYAACAASDAPLDLTTIAEQAMQYS